MRKFTAVILVVVLILSCFAGCQTEESDTEASSGGNTQSQKEQENVLPTEEPFDILTVLEWEAVSGGIEITNYTGSEKVVQVPEVIEGKKVISIGAAFSGNVAMEELILPESVTQPGDLRGCDALKILRAPGVIDIESGSYLPLTLEELYLPNLEEGFYVWSVFKRSSSDDEVRLKKIEMPKADNVYDITADEVIISDSIQYLVNGDCGDLSFTGGGYTEPLLITNENAADIYCYVFHNSKVIVNGVSYESDLDAASFREKYHEFFDPLYW